MDFISSPEKLTNNADAMASCASNAVVVVVTVIREKQPRFEFHLGWSEPKTHRWWEKATMSAENCPANGYY